MRVVLTRPAPEAQRWGRALAARGHEVLVFPLIDIGPAPDAQALQQAWSSLPGCQAAMFVSGNAVQGLFAAAAGQEWPAAARAWSPGPGTSQALAAAGVPAPQIDAPPADAAQFDSEALWPVIAPQVRAGIRVLLVRGAGADGRPAGRDWLAQQLEQAGARVAMVAAYARRRPDPGPDALAQAQRAASDGSVWLFSSSEAIANLRRLLPQQDWAQAQAIATHERIAQAARAAGFGSVRSSRPAEADVLAALESPR
ncbi:uroporphyrinogen-III synthase [Ramlibacter tataouinensis]|uniref:uroporphyrinogen-III synthase n=1 Tax=Ramlibacter tataouinensis TaxID=94132 RepID=UPI0022F3F839|nr:uroporphyrinogen-III synthase [Ramlibacter tataouinensis]WBY00863.1 uroporphyrinogen-III synthase [Ramlibacter tataouinensis]